MEKQASLNVARSIFDLTEEERRKVIAIFDSNISYDLRTGCWLWAGAKQRQGYGRLGAKCNGRPISILAHRVSYEVHVAPIPTEMVIDHRSCRTKACVNPAHLVACSRRENVLQPDGGAGLNAAKTVCPKGHPYSGYNLMFSPEGTRLCRTCWRDTQRRCYRARAKRLGKIDRRTITHCPTGHPYSGENLIVSGGRRSCRSCKNQKKRDKRRAREPERTYEDVASAEQ